MGIDRALVVDDDPLSREFLSEVLRRAGVQTVCAPDGRAALGALQKQEVDVLFTDLRMPGMSGIELLEKAHEASPGTTIVLTTAYASVQSAVEAMRKGAYDYIVKPFSPDEIEMLLARLKERASLRSQNEYLRREVEQKGDFSEIVTANETMRRICQETQRVAQSKATVLIQGESGTGKELIARALHYSSPRAGKPFIKVNCAALAESLLESELFGHERGAFTGAITKREGRFELADGGTLLLDEISEIVPRLQAKLLRVLEEEELERVGGNQTIKVDVRVIATTHRDLSREIEKGRFRADLFYRLNVVPIFLPPLRERGEDIEPLVRHFIRRFSAEYGVSPPSVADEAMRRLHAYDWPGNVRELRNLMHRVVVQGGDMSLPGSGLEPKAPGTPASGSNGKIHVGMSLEEAERILILETLERAGGNRTEAADILRVTTRTLRNKLAAYRQQGLLSLEGR